jgi:outer membrane protein TolC
MYKIVERINQLYVNILLGRENVKILNLYKQDLTNRYNNMKIAVENQTVLQSTLDELDAEILKTDQNIIESNFNLSGLYKTLSFFIGRDVDDKTVMLEPIGGTAAKLEVTRPELRMFDLQSKLLEERFSLTNSYALPRVTVGATGNYGRPGPNFINQELRFFASANLTVRWNVSSLYGLKRERTKLELSQDLVTIQREVFLYNVQASMNTQTAQLEALSQVIEKDDIIIEKRHSVTQTATSQMENGKITVANYLTQLNAELQAQLNKKVHEIKKMNAISTINTTSGSFKF